MNRNEGSKNGKFGDKKYKKSSIAGDFLVDPKTIR
jgi:hypothetical protein